MKRFKRSFILIGLVLSCVYFISCTKNTINTLAEPPYDYKFQADNYTLYANSEPRGEKVSDYHFSLYQGSERIGQTLDFRSDTRLSTSSTHNYDQWWAGGSVDCVLTGTTATIHVGTIKLELDFQTGLIHHSREYHKEMLSDLIASNTSGDKQIFKISYDAIGNIKLSNDLVLYNTQNQQTYYIMNGDYLKHIQFDEGSNIFAATVEGLRCYDSETGQSIELPFNISRYPYKFVDFAYDRENQVYIVAWVSQAKHDEATARVSIISADSSKRIDYDSPYKIADTEIFSQWPSLSLDKTGLELSGYLEGGSKQTFMAMSNAEYLKAIHDYAFRSGNYILYGRAVPTKEMRIDYHFSLYRGNQRIGNVLTFQSDTTTTHNFDIWWDEGMVDGSLSDTAFATVHVGYFKINLDFSSNQIQCVRDYKKEMLGELLTTNQAGDKKVYIINYNDTLNPNGLLRLSSDIVLHDTSTSQIHYLFDGYSLDQILFDHQNNILACDIGGIKCFDGNTYLPKELPFKFPYESRSYDFVDFLYDRSNKRYILAWAESSERIEMIPEETTSLEGVPNMKVSVFSADGSLLIEYDTQHIIPPIKMFDQRWPRLTLGDTGLELAGSFTDGSKRIFLSAPLSDYPSLLE